MRWVYQYFVDPPQLSSSPIICRVDTDVDSRGMDSCVSHVLWVSWAFQLQHARQQLTTEKSLTLNHFSLKVRESVSNVTQEWVCTLMSDYPTNTKLELFDSGLFIFPSFLLVTVVNFLCITHECDNCISEHNGVVCSLSRVTWALAQESWFKRATIMNPKELPQY